MFNKLKGEKRKKYFYYLFITIPLGYLMGIFIAYFVLKFIGLEFKLAVFIIIILLPSIPFVHSLINYYRELTKEPNEGQ